MHKSFAEKMQLNLIEFSMKNHRRRRRRRRSRSRRYKHRTANTKLHDNDILFLLFSAVFFSII